MIDEGKGVAVAPKPWSLSSFGELWALGGVVGYAGASVVERAAVVSADPLIGPLIRGLPSLALGILLLFARRTYRQLLPGSESYLGWRAMIVFIIPGVLSTIGLFAYYFALRLGGVAITVPVQQSFIVWGAIASWLYLGERFHRKAVMGVGILVLGLLVLTFGQMRGAPLSSRWYMAIPLALFTAISYGISGVFWRDGQLRGADQSTGIFLQFIASEITALIGLLWFGRFQALLETSPHDLGALFVGGILSGIVGIYGLFTSLKLMSVTRVYALFSLQPLVASVVAYFILKEYLNVQMMIGILLVCVGVAFVQVFKPVEETRTAQST